MDKAVSLMNSSKVYWSTLKVTGRQNLAGYKSNRKKLWTETNHLKSLPKSNLNRLIFAYLNINSIRNKFEFSASNVDLLIISETKIGNSFPKGQFLIKSFCEPFRIGRNIHTGEEFCSMLGKIFR